jgi:RNA polymerase sigma-70 factor (ECF subfamily)
MPMALDTPDEELASRAAHGDSAAFEALVRRHAEGLYAHCRGLMADTAGIDDVVQDALLKAYRSLGTFDPGRPFAPWLYRIAQNVCIDVLRRRKDWEPLQDGEQAAVSSAGSDPMEGLLSSLPGKYRAILQHKYALGLNAAEIAERLQLTHADVRVCLHRALKILRERLHR